MIISDIIAIVAVVIALGSAMVAIFAIYIPWRNMHDAEVFKEAANALARAYDALTQHGSKVSPPEANRLNWLTSARHILTYKVLRQRLKTNLYRTLCKETEEYWRHQFYLSLLLHSSYTYAYYKNGEIEPRSAAVLFTFADWPKGQPDPIDSVDFQKLYSESERMKVNMGFVEYLKQLPQYESKA